MDRRPALLSGGQRQRVAMGRAMVREPTAFLMDEPLSNLDAKLRVSMRVELARLHERLGVTTVYVTHDQVEAMTLGQRVAVLLDGVLQVRHPQRLFNDPTNLFVAAFIGSPSMNVVEADQAAIASHSRGSAFRCRRDRLLDTRRVTSSSGSAPLISGMRSTHPGEPRIVVRPDLVEELGGVTNVLFPIDAPRVQTDATLAAIEAASDDDATLLADDNRARFCASRRPAPRRAGRRSRAGHRPSASALLRPGVRRRNQSPVSGGGVSPRAVPSRRSVA